MKNEKRKWDGWWKDWITDVTLAQDMTIALIGLEMRSGYDIECGNDMFDQGGWNLYSPRVARRVQGHGKQG